VGFFALVSVLCGRLLFGEAIATATWVGVGVVLLGSLIMQFGPSR
jgi:drug/metabolite transporter (DMT)-like permease